MIGCRNVGLFVLMALMTPVVVAGQQETKTTATGRIRGTVTFFFNQYQGHKPDIGAEVVVTPGPVYISESSTVVMVPTLLAVDGKQYDVTAHTIVDGSGNFELPDVPVGEYTLVIKSSNVRGGFHFETVTTDKKGRPLKKAKTIQVVNQRDVLGRIMTLHARVEAGKTDDESYDFGISSW